MVVLLSVLGVVWSCRLLSAVDCYFFRGLLIIGYLWFIVLLSLFAVTAAFVIVRLLVAAAVAVTVVVTFTLHQFFSSGKHPAYPDSVLILFFSPDERRYRNLISRMAPFLCLPAPFYEQAFLSLQQVFLTPE